MNIVDIVDWERYFDMYNSTAKPNHDFEFNYVTGTVYIRKMFQPAVPTPEHPVYPEPMPQKIEPPILWFRDFIIETQPTAERPATTDNASKPNMSVDELLFGKDDVV